MARFTVFVTALVLFGLLAVPALGAGEPLPRIRYSVAPDTVRVVLDLPAETTFVDRSTPRAGVAAIAVPLDAALPAITVDDPLVTGITLAPDDAGQALLTVTLAQPRKCHLFTLPADKDHPFRIVLDVLKLFSTEKRQTLTPAISYTRIERQTADRYLAMHFLDIDTKQPQVHFTLMAAQGGRERVCAMVTRAGAICGVNGGFFLEGTRPVGLLKSEGKVLALPLWGRTAVAFPRTGAPLFDNPHGIWRLTLPDHTTRDLPDALDATILTPPPTAIVYNGNLLTHVAAVPEGLNLLIRAGHVLSHAPDATSLAAGDWALQLRGDAVHALGDLLKDGAEVTLTPVLFPDWEQYPNAVGAGPRLLRDGKVEITAAAEHIKPDIATGRRARTGFGVTATGQVVVAVVEAPGPYGGGATLEELAALLSERGAVDAMNLDGGGSTELAIGPDTQNIPATDWIRPVASGVLVFDDRVPPAPRPDDKKSPPAPDGTKLPIISRR